MMKIALVKEGKVDNVAEFRAFEEALAMAEALAATPVDVTNIAAWIGDTYDGEHFFRDGEPLLSVFQSDLKRWIAEGDVSAIKPVGSERDEAVTEEEEM